MKNKLARLVFILVTAIWVPGIYNTLHAQQTTNTSSPYSRFGVGELQYNSIPRFMGMGGVSTGVNDSTYINFENPASYNTIGRYTMFDAGARASFVRLNTTTKQADANSVNFSHLFIAIPVIHRQWAMNFGVIPFSNEGYNFTQSQPLQGYNDIQINYQGSGGLTSAMWGNSITLYRGLKNRSKTINPDTVSNKALRKIMRDTMPETSRLAFGFNVNYLFGTLNSQSSSLFPDTTIAYNTRQIRSVRVDGLSILAGLQYTKRFKGEKALTLGATYSYGMNQSARENLFIGSYVNTGEIDFYLDTLSDAQNKKGSIKLPSSYSFGFTYRQGNTWMLGADFKTTDWKGYRYFGQADDVLNNSYQVSAGAQFVPDYTAKKLSLRRTAYRLGARYGRTYLNLNNTPVNEWGVSVGIGLLLNPSGYYQKIFKVPFSSMNVAAEFGQRGTTTNSLIREDFVRVSLAFTFSDKWFNKYKLE
jgi:hypothetical protein